MAGAAASCFLMFQYTCAPAGTRPLDVLAQRGRVVVLAQRHVAGRLERAQLERLGELLLVGVGVGLRELGLEFFDVLSSCQPNQPLSPVAFIIAIVSGFRMSPAVQEVMKAFQPPLSGASFLARRATSVDQSICCMSTLKPAASSCCLATSGSLRDRRQVGRAHQHDGLAVVAGLLQQLPRPSCGLAVPL